MDASDTSYEAVERLARQVGIQSTDFSSEHDRWPVYQRAIQEPSTFDQLKRCIRDEQDDVVAHSAVLLVLERVTADEAEAWLSLLPMTSRDHATVRASEIQVLGRAIDSELPTPEVDEQLELWTDWLQRRLVPHLDAESLSVLAARARTKKVRTASAQRLRTIQV
ncbi:hypothetical protein [Aeromicrobium sp. 9AM]|uniref:hypothetical protein n=1 Tax=Aeromicrobium sp. 9AM TaxID=2653126 RepID=UPI001359EB46|nr:hypothetical protein [Aeromicrobium sp. 9AM]